MPTILGSKGKREVDSPAKPALPSWFLPALTITGSVMILLVSILTYIMVGYNRIYPEVYSDGVRLGGLSLDDAGQVTLQHVTDKLKYSELRVTVADVTDVFTPENTAAKYTAGQTALDAYDVGRKGGFFHRIGQLWSAYFGRVDVPLNPGLEIDESYVRGRIQAISEQLDRPVVEYTYEIGSRSIIIQNAVEGRRVNQESILEGVLRAMASLDFTPQTYQPEPLPFRPLDIEALHSRIYVEPRDAYLDTDDPGNAVIRPHVTGVDFDRAALAEALKNDVPVIVVPLILNKPQIETAALQAALFRDELSSYTTYLAASNKPRTSNIRLAADYINGIMLAPGDSFSYNGIVGKRTPDRGFQEAGAYVNGQLVPEIGGGICQLSTTTYNAALLANLEITERSNHSMTVSYVPLGRDAMVNWGTQDLRFVNNTSYPIRILAEQSDNYVRVTIMGTIEHNLVVSIEGTTLSSTPAQHVERVNTEMEPGTTKVVQDGHNGHVVETYRVIKDSQGNLISRTKEATSRYRKVDKITEIGPALEQPSPEPTPGVTPDPVSPSPTPDTSPEPDTPPSDASPTPEPIPDVTPPIPQDDYQWGA